MYRVLFDRFIWRDFYRDSFLVPILDILTGFYAGFAIFTVLGNMYLSKCASSFAEVAAQGPELAFVVYPEGSPIFF